MQAFTAGLPARAAQGTGTLSASACAACPLTLDCLVMLNLFTRPPVRPAAATQLPQLLHVSRSVSVKRQWARQQRVAPCLAGQHRGMPATEMKPAAGACQRAPTPWHTGYAPDRRPGQPPGRAPPAHIVVQQQRLKPVCALAPVDAQVQGQKGGHVLAAAVGHEAWARQWGQGSSSRTVSSSERSMNIGAERRHGR